MIHRIRFAVGFCFSLALLATLATGVRAGAGAPEGAAPAKGVSGPAAPEPRPELPGPRYLLRYKFKPGETVRWKVEHRAEVRTTVNGVTQTAETLSNSVKVWRVTSFDEAKRQAKFVHSVDSVDMRQVLSGRQEVRYNSQTDATPPPGFEDVAKDVGVPLCEFTIDLLGHVLLRDKKGKEDARPSQGEITVQLPDHEVAVGEVWSQPNVVTVKYKDGSPKQVKTRQDYKLVEVEKGIAKIQLESTIVTPINDPTIDAQLIQQVVDGVIRFDIDAGRVISQQTDIDKHVIGFQGESSSLHYVTRFNERLTNEEGTKTSAKAPTGPQPPPATASKTAQAPGKPTTGAAATGKQSTVKPSTPTKVPAAQTARVPSTKRESPTPAKQPSTPAKSTTPNTTARRDPPAATPPAATKSATPPLPPAPANEIQAEEPDPDA